MLLTVEVEADVLGKELGAGLTDECVVVVGGGAEVAITVVASMIGGVLVATAVAMVISEEEMVDGVDALDVDGTAVIAVVVDATVDTVVGAAVVPAILDVASVVVRADVDTTAEVD